MMNERQTAKTRSSRRQPRSGGPYKETAATIRSHFDKHYGPPGRRRRSFGLPPPTKPTYFSVKAHVPCAVET